jgi:glucose-6-phosphate 1-dehydrogenase
MKVHEPAAAADRRERPGDPCTIVIFGVSGDLARRKLIPALYNLAKDRLLPKEIALVGVAREPLTVEVFRDRLRQALDEFGPADQDPAVRDALLGRVHYLSGDFTSGATFAALRELLAQVDAAQQTQGNHLYYLATPPTVFAPLVHQLGAAGLLAESDGHWRRVIVEKPFGEDLESARALNQELRRDLAESQIYRIDHYLGKETVQNIMIFRFANGIFEPVWNRRYIDHVQITVAESVGVEKRGGYYDQAGALRDMVPNHIFQLLSFIAMEPPISFEAGAVRDEKAKVMHAIPPMTPEEVLVRTVRGQYGEGEAEGVLHAGYRAEPKVIPGSSTETFIAMKLFIDNWRWAGVPFFIRAGKSLPLTATEVTVTLKRPPLSRLTAGDTNYFRFRLSPEVVIGIGARVKRPGEEIATEPTELKVVHKPEGDELDAYERLLGDAMEGDRTLFARQDGVEAAWAIVEPILCQNTPLYEYDCSAWGPREAEALTADVGGWHCCEPPVAP